MSLLLRNRNSNGGITPPIDTKYRKLCQDAAWRLRWDYNGWRNLGTGSPYTQRDWNQTLITKINQISAQIHKATMRGGANVIITSPHIISIIEDFDYYNSEEKTIGSRYKVEVDHGIHPMEILVYFDPPSHLELVADVKSNRYYGAIRVDGVMGYVEPEPLPEEKESTMLDRKYLLLTKNLVV